MLPPGPAQATGEFRITHNVTPSAPSKPIPLLNSLFHCKCLVGSAVAARAFEIFLSRDVNRNRILFTR